jgi:hypothetical protein
MYISTRQTGCQKTLTRIRTEKHELFEYDLLK